MNSKVSGENLFKGTVEIPANTYYLSGNYTEYLKDGNGNPTEYIKYSYKYTEKLIKINPCKTTKVKAVLKPYTGAVEVVSKDGKSYDVYIAGADSYGYGGEEFVLPNERAIVYDLEPSKDYPIVVDVESSPNPNYKSFEKEYTSIPLGKIKTIKCSTITSANGGKVTCS